MTDLEKAWDDLPVSPAPTERILREARRAEMNDDAALAAATDTVRAADRRRRFLIRPLLTAGVATAVVGAFVAGSVLDGGTGGTGGELGAGDAGEDPARVAFAADLTPAASCEDLLADYVDRGLDRVTAWGWSAPYRYRLLRDSGLDVSPMATTEVSTKSAYNGDVGTTRATNSDTGTNVQEAGVDEPDTVKTDGELLFRVRGEELLVLDVSGNRVEGLGSVRLDGITSPEILLAGDTVVAVGKDERAVRRADGSRPGTRVLAVDVSDPAAPTVTEEASYDAALTSVRQHGDVVRLVVAGGLPDLDFLRPGKGTTRKQALEHNRTAVEESTVGDWLPTITRGDGADGGTDDGAGDGAAEQLLDCTDVALTPDEVALGSTAVVGFDAADVGDVDAIGLAGTTDLAYESTDHLYLAASPGWSGGWDTAVSRVDCRDCWFPQPVPSVEGGTSHLFDFELDGRLATHVASGEVEGDIRDRWSMDEAGDVLRVAVGPTQDTGNFNSVLTLERRGEDLVEVGRLDRLGVNEDIRSVRWFDGLAIVVTFRRIDPLYAIDLSDARSPTLLGELKIPGFSSYLHPLGSKRLIGVGAGPREDGGWGAQMGLFDVTDLSDVRRLAVHSYDRRTAALAGRDPRAFTWVPEHRTVLTVIRSWNRTQVGYLAITRIVGGELRTTMRQVEYGPDVTQVRTVPVGEGRVVLVTGERVEFLDLE